MPDRDTAIRKYKAQADTYTSRLLLRTLENRRSKLKVRYYIVGMMWAPWWALSTNLRTWKMAREFCTTLEGIGKPWSHLEILVPNLTAEQGIFHGFGAYIAVGGSELVRALRTWSRNHVGNL
jgi:hypothetical protein